jgi:hypothetical protein
LSSLTAAPSDTGWTVSGDLTFHLIHLGDQWLTTGGGRSLLIAHHNERWIISGELTAIATPLDGHWIITAADVDLSGTHSQDNWIVTGTADDTYVNLTASALGERWVVTADCSLDAATLGILVPLVFAAN